MHSGRAKLVVYVVGSLVATVLGCAPETSLDVWVACEMQAVTGDSQPPTDRAVYDPDRRSLRLFAAANGTAAFQIVADAGDGGARNVRVVCSKLTGPDGATLPETAFSVYRMLPVRVNDYPGWFLRRSADRPEPRDYYDVLLPADAPGAGRWDVGADGRFAAWVDVHVPRDAEPGHYRAAVTLSADGAEDRRIELDLEVYDFVLPDARTLPAVGGFDHREVFGATVRRDGRPFVPSRLNPRDDHVRRGLVAVRELMLLARRHRLDLFDKRIHPVLKRDAAGRVRLDWDDYEAIVSPYVTGSAFDDGEPVAFWPLPLHAGWPDPDQYGGPDQTRYVRTVGEIAEGIADFLDRSDADARWVFWPVRGEPGPHARERQADLVRTARPALENVPILSTLPPDRDHQADPADILAPPGHWFKPDAAQPDESPPADRWLAPSRGTHVPSLHPAAGPADPRALVWVAMRYEAAGLMLPEVLDWSDDPTHHPTGDRLFYPGPAYGTEGILPSARLKRLRRGLEDAAMCDLLRQRARGGIARGLANTLVRYAGIDATGEHRLDPRIRGWSEDAYTWHRASRLLAEEVRVAVHAADDDAVLSRQRVAWRLLTERTRAVSVERVSTRVFDADQGRLRAEMQLDLHNPLARSVEVSVDQMDLPEGWSPTEPPEPEVELSAGASGRLRLAIVSERVEPTTSGKLPVELTLNLPGDNRHVSTALPLLIVESARRSPQIDGRLDDWPLGRGNVAGDFRLVGRRGMTGDGLAERQTTALVLRDSRNLYVAFICREPNPDGMVAHPDNRVRHEDSLPVGEDLVEVVLDPGRNAQSPEDLYHVVVKSNGVVRVWRGAPGSETHRPWAADVEAAVGSRDGQWVVELALPLSAFGEDADESWWGVNFNRFAFQGKEASSWTGDPRSFYLPRTLGTMFMGRPDSD